MVRQVQDIHTAKVDTEVPVDTRLYLYREDFAPYYGHADIGPLVDVRLQEARAVFKMRKCTRFDVIQTLRIHDRHLSTLLIDDEGLRQGLSHDPLTVLGHEPRSIGRGGRHKVRRDREAQLIRGVQLEELHLSTTYVGRVAHPTLDRDELEQASEHVGALLLHPRGLVWIHVL